MSLRRTRFDCHSIEQNLLSLVIFFLPPINFAEREEGIGGVGIDLQRFSERSFGFVPLLKVHVSGAQL